jgi:hypothetical protein
MATAAAPFVHPRLAVVDSKVRATVEVNGKLSADELRARARQAIAEAFAERPVIDGEYHHVVAGKDTADMLPAPQKQANGETSDERDGSADIPSA